MDPTATSSIEEPPVSHGSSSPIVGDRAASKKARLPLHINLRTLTAHLFFGPYIFIPLVTALVWLTALLALISIWSADGHPRYADKEGDIVFISNVAGKHKGVFIPLACVTAVGFVLSLIAERWLRHIDRLPTNVRRREKILNSLAIFFAALGGSGLIALSIKDNFNHSTVHWSMTVVFVVGTALSAIFQTGAVWSLHKDHPDRKHLLRNSIFKMIVVIVACAGAIVFAALYGVCRGKSYARKHFSAHECNRITSTAAVMEWVIAFILVFYFFSLVADLWPAGKSSPRYMAQLARWQEVHEPQALQHDFTGRRAFGQHIERWQTPRSDMDVDPAQRFPKAANEGSAL